MYNSGFDSDGKWIDTMQVCRNGHVINDSYHKYPESNQNYCQKCGKKTITECENCEKPIQGRVYYSGGLHIGPISVPNYCQHCQAAYPWHKGGRKWIRRGKSSFSYLKGFIKWIVELIPKALKLKG